MPSLPTRISPRSLVALLTTTDAPAGAAGGEGAEALVSSFLSPHAAAVSVSAAAAARAVRVRMVVWCFIVLLLVLVLIGGSTDGERAAHARVDVAVELVGAGLGR